MALKRTAQTALAEAKSSVVIRLPFFASLLLRYPVTIDKACPTACVNKRGQIYIGDSFIKELNKDQLVFTLCHEVMHVAFAHAARMKNRDAKLWNVACDAVINHMLIKNKVGQFIEGGIHFDWVGDNMSAEQVYNKLLQQQPPQQPQPGQSGDGQGGGEPQPGEGSGGDSDGDGDGIGNDLKPDYKDDSDMPESEVNRAVENGKRDLAGAATMERMRRHKDKSRGSGGGCMGDMISDYLGSKIKWHEVLAQYCQGKVKSGYNWAKPNKRYLRYAHLPRRDDRPAMGKVCVGIDTSGSIGDDEMREFFGHINAIVESCNPESVDVLYVTSRIECHEHFDRQDYPLAPQHNRWCGGTDMTEITKWVDEQADDYDVVVIFTDGYTPVPESCKAHVFWVLTEPCDNKERFIGDVYES